MLKEGDKAPEFTALDHEGKDVTLGDLLAKGKRLILYFYPKDNTPGCTLEACDFRDRKEVMGERGAIVVGVSPDSVKSHAGFRQKHDLPFMLLSDPDKAMARAYGAWGEKKNYGKTYMGIIRSTFIIGADGTVQKAMYGVRATGHAEEVAGGL